MHESVKVSMIANISKYGYFLHLLATFGIENGYVITLPLFGDLKYAENIYHVRAHILKLKIKLTH